jgi:hypothetical protein
LHGQASNRKSETDLEKEHSSLETIEEYTEDGEFRIPLQPTLLNQGKITRPMFRGDGQPCAESVGVDEEDLIEIGSLGEFHYKKLECFFVLQITRRVSISQENNISLLSSGHDAKHFGKKFLCQPLRLR